MHVLAVVLVGIGTACELVCLLGVLWFRDAFDQLHYSSAASTVGVFAFGVAAVLTGFPSVSGTIECVIALFLVFVLNASLTVGTGRAGRKWRQGTLAPKAAEYEERQ